MASTLQPAELLWFIPGWFARGMLNCIIGRKNAGKSSCTAWLMAQAKRPAILPGYEEGVELMQCPRWSANKVLLRSLLVLDDQTYSPQLQKGLLIQILRQHKTDLLIIENLNSYLPGDVGANDPQGVRAYLESLAAIAAATGACVVGTRHPGKEPGNICPDSREWENVPRIIAVVEEEPSRPGHYWLWSHRCGVGPQPEPLAYTLPRLPNTVPVFTPALEGSRQQLELAQAAPDALDRDRLQAAMELLAGLLDEDWVEAKEVFVAASREQLGEGTIRRAAKLLQVQFRRTGSGLNHRSFWGRKGLDLPWSEADQR
jgi:hypothetical protein